MRLVNLAKEHINIIENMYFIGRQQGSYEAVIKNIYSFVKTIAPNYYHNNQMSRIYFEVVRKIISYEQIFPSEYIIDLTPKFDMNNNSKITNKSEPIDILNYLVNETRKLLVLEQSWDTEKNIDIKDLILINKCKDASDIVKDLCDALNIESYVLMINPGYNKLDSLYNGDGFHYCVIVKLEDKYYLIDCTYSQFFLTKYNFLERLGIVGLSGCDLGIFMTMTESRNKVATKILEDGWIELTETTIKDYFDGFTISYRNGLYYEDTLDFSYTTEYTVDDYKRFILRSDWQTRHEKRRCLGYQREPLKNHNLSFRKR